METLRTILLSFLFLLPAASFAAEPREPAFRVLVVASRAKDHLKMIAAARPVFEAMAKAKHFSVDFTDDASVINDENLAHYQAFVMLHLAPFDMTPSQQAALQKFVESGKGWVGVHAAGLTGKEFLDPASVYWDWFEGLMGGVIYSPHPHYQHGTVVVEDRKHPVTKGLPAKFEISDEWYEFDHSPRGAVKVLATADESTYHPNKPMGDHPVVWVNERFRRMVYLAIGHDPSILENKDYLRLLTNAVVWAGGK